MPQGTDAPSYSSSRVSCHEAGARVSTHPGFSAFNDAALVPQFCWLREGGACGECPFPRSSLDDTLSVHQA